MHHASSPTVWPRLAGALRRDPTLTLLLVALGLLAAVSDMPLALYPTLVDWPTMAALTGLLVLTKGVEVSGGLQRLGGWLTGRLATERRAALCLVLAAAALSTLLTNDVALFVVVPLTLGIARLTGLAQATLLRLVVFEALAVNAGSALTPMGNPQNLFLWQLSHTSFAGFIRHMAPLVAVLMVLLLLLTAASFKGRALRGVPQPSELAMDPPLLWLSLALYVPFLVLTDLRQAGWAVAAVVLAMAVLRPRVLVQTDWALLLVFVLMFVDLRLLAGLAPVRGLMASHDLVQPQTLFLLGIAASQLISNVPAVIALAEYTQDWPTLAYAVNVGGFGLVVGSLANLIALRMVADRRAWWVFHLYSVPFLLVSGLVVYLLWFGRL